MNRTDTDVTAASNLLAALWGRVPKDRRQQIIREWFTDGGRLADDDTMRELGEECHRAAAELVP